MLRCLSGGKTQPNRIKKESSLAARLHPRLRDWFFASFPTFTQAQLLCVPSVLKRESILLTSPTGSGKTLAGFLGVFDSLLRELDSGGLKAGVRCVYVSPLRALAYDIEKNLRAPIAGMGLEKELRIHLRTGDTTATERTKFRNQPSPFLVTTPESLAILLAQESYAQHLAKTEFVIVDELHSFAGNKRGADLSISLERLGAICSGGRLGRPIRSANRLALRTAKRQPEKQPLSDRPFRYGRAGSLARRISCQNGPQMPHRRGAHRERTNCRRFFSNPARSVSTIRLHRCASLRGVVATDSLAAVGHCLHKCPLGRGTNRTAIARAPSGTGRCDRDSSCFA
jgi:hypothetical protein